MFEKLDLVCLKNWPMMKSDILLCRMRPASEKYVAEKKWRATF
jgi:hypothetical protein